MDNYVDWLMIERAPILYDRYATVYNTQDCSANILGESEYQITALEGKVIHLKSILRDYYERSLKKTHFEGPGSIPIYAFWLIRHVFVLLIDLAARHTPIVGVREALYRAMGFDIGRGVFIAENVHLDRTYRDFLHIGNGSTIQYNTVLFCHQRNLEAYRKGMWFRDCDYMIAPVNIGKRVMIGPNCVILPGVTIGEGAIVGAGSVVYKDVPPYSMVMGAPARVIRRYT